MGINTIYSKRYIALFVGFLFFFLLSGQKAFAVNGTIKISPQSGNYTSGQVFNVDIDIDGNGSSLNTAEATVTISSTLGIENIIIGDCGFAFVRTPTQANPSFVGVILGGSVKTCTAYTLVLKAISPGTGTVALSNASLKSYKGAMEILMSLQNGSYVINADSSGINPVSVVKPSPTQAPLVGNNGTRLYDIVFTAPVPKGVPISAIQVTLDPELPERKTVIPTSTQGIPVTVTATFEGVPQGVHTIVTFYNGKPLFKQIMNVGGNNKTLAFGVGAKRPSTSWTQYLILVVSLICLGILTVFLYKFYHKTNSQKTIPQ